MLFTNQGYRIPPDAGGNSALSFFVLGVGVQASTSENEGQKIGRKKGQRFEGFGSITLLSTAIL